MNLRLVHYHLELTAPAKLDNLGWGRGGLQGGGSSGAWVGEGEGGLLPSLEGGGVQVLCEP